MLLATTSGTETKTLESLTAKAVADERFSGLFQALMRLIKDGVQSVFLFRGHVVEVRPAPPVVGSGVGEEIEGEFALLLVCA